MQNDKHPSRVLITGYLVHSRVLTLQHLREIEAHIESCAACQAVLTKERARLLADHIPTEMIDRYLVACMQPELPDWAARVQVHLTRCERCRENVADYRRCRF